VSSTAADLGLVAEVAFDYFDGAVAERFATRWAAAGTATARRA
jgi:hypothetical protein